MVKVAGVHTFVREVASFVVWHKESVLRQCSSSACSVQLEITNVWKGYKGNYFTRWKQLQ